MEKIIMILELVNRNEVHDIEVPLDISANDLVLALNKAYNLGLDVNNISERYLKTENPIALLKGSKSLREYDLRNGTRIIITR